MRHALGRRMCARKRGPKRKTQIDRFTNSEEIAPDCRSTSGKVPKTNFRPKFRLESQSLCTWALSRVVICRVAGGDTLFLIVCALYFLKTILSNFPGSLRIPAQVIAFKNATTTGRDPDGLGAVL